MKPDVNGDWERTEKKFPFGLVLLIGGGIAAAYGAQVSGLAPLIAKVLNKAVESMNDQLALFVLVTAMVFITGVMSNTGMFQFRLFFNITLGFFYLMLACVTLLMPVFRDLAKLRGK